MEEKNFLAMLKFGVRQFNQARQSPAAGATAAFTPGEGRASFVQALYGAVPPDKSLRQWLSELGYVKRDQIFDKLQIVEDTIDGQPLRMLRLEAKGQTVFISRFDPEGIINALRTLQNAIDMAAHEREFGA